MDRSPQASGARRLNGLSLYGASFGAGAGLAPHYRCGDRQLSGLSLLGLDARARLVRCRRVARGWLRRGVFVASVVGRPFRMVRGRTRNFARNRSRHRLPRSTVRTAPRQAICRLACRAAHLPAHVALRRCHRQRHHGADGFRVCVERRHERARPASNGGALLQEAGNLDLSEEVREANVLSGQLTALGNGELRKLTGPEQPVTVLLRSDEPDIRQSRAPIVVMINTDLHHRQALPISLHPLPPAAGVSLSAANVLSADRNCGPTLEAGGVRVLRSHRNQAIKSRRKEMLSTKLMAAPRIVIDGIVPSVDGGRFAAKRIIGELVTVEADVFTDGHDILVVELLWRAADEKEWRRVAMQLLEITIAGKRKSCPSASAATNLPSKPGSTDMARYAAIFRLSGLPERISPRDRRGTRTFAENRKADRRWREQRRNLGTRMAARGLGRCRCRYSADAGCTRGDAGSRGSRLSLSPRASIAVGS